jgi:hypothetical protein
VVAEAKAAPAADEMAAAVTIRSALLEAAPSTKMCTQHLILHTDFERLTGIIGKHFLHNKRHAPVFQQHSHDLQVSAKHGSRQRCSVRQRQQQSGGAAAKVSDRSRLYLNLCTRVAGAIASTFAQKLHL